jgi:hypothetical protein
LDSFSDEAIPMHPAVFKGLLTLGASCIFFGVSVALFLTRRSLGSALQAVGIGCFGVMALTHVFEAFSILPSLGWGQPHGPGHFIDLVAALLGVTLVTASFLVRPRDRRRDDAGAR